MFKNFKGTVITEDQALLAMKMLKVGFETGLFQKTFEYAMDKQNVDSYTREQLNVLTQEATSRLEMFNNDEDFSEELWYEIDNINKKMYDIFGITEEEYYTIGVEYAQSNPELAVETAIKQFDLIN
nr:MAG TPA: hypothetical protein [Caudoviricetes sp.]